MGPERLARLCLCGLLVGGASITGCSDDGGVRLDAASEDAGFGDAGERDAGLDVGFSYGDAGPTPTGCELFDAGAPSDASDPGGDAGLPDPGAFAPAEGPGGPRETFESSELYVACAHLDGGPTDQDHHNLVTMYEGYLVMPWAHERGGGGVSIFDVSDACAPRHIGTTTSTVMRETHTLGFSRMGGRFMVTASLAGILFWDLADLARPVALRDFTLPGVVYPDSYMRVVMSTFWQVPYVYVGAADNGVFIVDASDPSNPRIVNQIVPEPVFRVGGVFAIGNLLMIQGLEGSRSALYDISDPANPRPYPGGTFLLTTGETDPRGRPMFASAYFGHLNGDHAYFARKDLGGGLILIDIRDPYVPSFVSAYASGPGGNGGYVFVKEETAFVGFGGFADIIDVSDPSAPTRLARLDMQGDFDTLTPIGNVVVGSVDDDAVDGEASAIFPYAEAVDEVAPRVNRVVPRDGAVGNALTTRVGLSFTELVDDNSVWRGSFIVRKVGSAQPLEGHYSAQEGIVNFWPSSLLAPDTLYEVLVPAGGVRDVSGNATTTAFRSTFRTVACGGP